MTKAKYNVQTEAEVRGLGTVVYVHAPFDKGWNALTSEGAVQISAKNLAYARIKLGEEHSVSENGSWVKEGVLHVPNSENKIILTRDSLIVNHPKKATDSHRRFKEYFVSKKESDEVIEKVHSGDNSVYILKDLSSVPTNRLGDDERTVWFFGDVAEKYGNFLKELGHKEFPFFFDEINYIDNKEKPYANLLFFNRHNSGTGIGDFMDLGCYYWIRGVLNFEEKYTFKQISTALKELKFSGLEKQLLDVLKKEGKD